VKTLDGESRFVDPMTAFEYFEKWKRRRRKNVEAVKKYRYEATDAWNETIPLGVSKRL
jgi:hypothetical protein